MEFNPEIMAVGKTCRTCWNAGHKKTIRYKAAPKACVRCRAVANAKYNKTTKEVNS